MSVQTPGFVQSIVVRPSTHFDTVAAAALASGLAMAAADLTLDPWQSWLSDSFTKSVRRAKRPADLERVRLLADELRAGSAEAPHTASTEITVGDAVAISFAPQRYDESPPAISRLQVSGLDLVRETGSFYRPAALIPRIEVNSDVSMSTGKTAAQVAHALGAWLLAQTVDVRVAWSSAPGLSITEASFVGSDAAHNKHDLDDPSIITIVDNGLTEIAPGTPTARVYLG